MQQHSGEHMISGLLHSHFGLENVGFHLSDREVTLDMNGEVSLNNCALSNRKPTLTLEKSSGQHQLALLRRTGELKLSQ